MRHVVVGAFAMFLVGSDTPAVAQSQRDRPIRVGNTNVLLGGAVWESFDHPNFASEIAPNVSYMHRIFRREVRLFPVWLRAGINYRSENRDSRNAYTVWPSNLPPGTLPFPEDYLSEKTSDFTMRAELLGDLVHMDYGALYAAGGFAVHYLTFSTRGCAPRADCSSNTFQTTESRLAPSAAAGFRLFTPRQPYTLYSEVRYGRAYGKTDVSTAAYLTTNTFAFTPVDAISFEGGFGFHW
jgi:hypothetical protein